MKSEDDYAWAIAMILVAAISIVTFVSVHRIYSLENRVSSLDSEIDRLREIQESKVRE